MKELRFKPRATFNADLKRLALLDHTIVDKVRAAIAGYLNSNNYHLSLATMNCNDE